MTRGGSPRSSSFRSSVRPSVSSARRVSSGRSSGSVDHVAPRFSIITRPSWSARLISHSHPLPSNPPACRPRLVRTSQVGARARASDLHLESGDPRRSTASATKDDAPQAAHKHLTSVGSTPKTSWRSPAIPLPSSATIRHVRPNLSARMRLGPCPKPTSGRRRPRRIRSTGEQPWWSAAWRRTAGPSALEPLRHFIPDVALVDPALAGQGGGCAGSDDQRDCSVSAAMISSMRSEMSVRPLRPAAAAPRRRRGPAPMYASIAVRVSSEIVVPRRSAS